MKRNPARERARKKRRLAKRKQSKITPYLVLLKQADAVFSKWIRNRDGWACIVCGTKENIQNGHLIPRGKKSVRFDEYNCNALCGSCNWNDNYWHYLYETKWLAKYGVDEMMKLSERANVKAKKISREELQSIITRYS